MISIITEQTFASSYWCSQYLRGINSEAKRKNIKTRIINDISELERGADSDIAILIGTSLSWLYKTIDALREKKIKAVVLSAQKSQGFGSGVSFVSMDYEDALEKLMMYFDRINRKRTALFSINPDSTTDQSKRSAFLSCKTTCKEQDIYYFHDTLEEVCAQFCNNIENYDSVICANHISEIVLTKFLTEKGYNIPDDIHIAVFGDSEVKREGKMLDNTLIRVNPTEAGKLAIRSVRLLSNHTDLSRVSFGISCDIITKDGIIDFSDVTTKKLPTPDTSFAPSAHSLSSALTHEKVLCNCDKIDMEILKSILRQESYAKIARRIHISENTIGYRIKRLMQFAGTKSKDEMIETLKPYLN